VHCEKINTRNPSSCYMNKRTPMICLFHFKTANSQCNKIGLDSSVSRNRADDLFTQLEQASNKLMHVLQQGSAATDTTEPLAEAQTDGSLLCIRKHRRNGSIATGPLSQDDVLRMLVHESRHSRALAVYLCPGASAFHVFSPTRLVEVPPPRRRRRGHRRPPTPGD
jgi:hypothetical protein